MGGGLQAVLDPYGDQWMAPRADDPQVPPDVEQTYLLGGRWQDYGLAVFFALLLPLLRSLLKSHVFEPAGKWVFQKRGITGTKAEQADRLRKWCESMWKMSIYILFTTMAYLVARGNVWFADTRHYWLGCSKFPPCNLSVDKGVLLFYCVETGFYLQAIHFLMFIEVRRKDWLESMIHHVVTLALLAYSYYLNFTRVGVMVILIHDCSDIALEAAKMARYARRQDIATVAFVVFTAVWIASRVVYYPLVIIRSTLFETLYYARRHGIDADPHYTIFNALLLVLFVLHVYWTYLILRILVLEVSRGNAHDIREDDPDNKLKNKGARKARDDDSDKDD